MESDEEIEFLDEDADIVQQCVQPQLQPDDLAMKTLLVERPTGRKRKRKKEEEDSDYDPNNDVLARGPIVEPKKKKTTARKSAAKPRKHSPANIVNTSLRNVTKTYQSINKELQNRKKMDIRIPDYQDPLCLPVKAMKTPGSDQRRLKHWNNACMDHLRHCDTPLKPEKGRTKKSIRTVVLRNVVHKETKKFETAIWSKTCVENEEGTKKSEIFQCILPKFREKKMLNSYPVYSMKKKIISQVNEVLLTKEVQNDGEVLVAYKPKDSISAIYKFVKNNKINNPEGEEERATLKETAFCRVCASCYQTSWRGSNKQSDARSLKCPVCHKDELSTYNLLSHLKGHSSQEVRPYRKELSRTFADIVNYHYKCRICQKDHLSIKALRQHIVTHKGTTPFKCEVGNHMAT